MGWAIINTKVPLDYTVISFPAELSDQWNVADIDKFVDWGLLFVGH